METTIPFDYPAAQLLQSAKDPSSTFFWRRWYFLCWSILFSGRTLSDQHHRIELENRRAHTSVLFSQKRRHLYLIRAVASRTSGRCLAANRCSKPQLGNSSLRSDPDMCGRISKLFALLDGDDMAQQKPSPLRKKPRSNSSSCIREHWKGQILSRVQSASAHWSNPPAPTTLLLPSSKNPHSSPACGTRPLRHAGPRRRRAHGQTISRSRKP